ALRENSGAPAMIRSSSPIDAARPFIFQLPATSGRRDAAIWDFLSSRSGIFAGAYPLSANRVHFAGICASRQARAPEEACATHFPPSIQDVAVRRRDPYDCAIRV